MNDYRKPISGIWLTPQSAKLLYLPVEYNDYCPFPQKGFDIFVESNWKNKHIPKYINPPFSILPKLSKLINKKAHEGFKIIICCPVRYNTRYFQNYLKPIINEICICNERVKFIDGTGTSKSNVGCPFVCNFLYINCESKHKQSEIKLTFA